MNHLRAGFYGLVGILFMSAALELHAAPVATPGLVDLGFTDFRVSGYAKAFATWSYAGPLAQDPGYCRRLAASGPFWNSLGRCLGYDNVQAQPISNRTTLVTLTAQFDRGEVFFRFIVYQNLSLTTITSLDWTTDIAQWEN